MPDTQSGRITVTCACGAKLGLRASFAGHKAKCPKCGRSFVVPNPDQGAEAAPPAYSEPEPAPARAPKPAATAEGTMKVNCPCGKHIRVPVNATGRKARCPACGGIFVIGQAAAKPAAPKPAPEPEPEPQTPQLEEYQEEDDGTYGWSDGGGSLLAEAEQQPAIAGAANCKLCPNCGQTMPLETRLCVACGFDTKTGRRAGETAVSGGGGGALSGVGEMLGSAVKSSGALMLGTVLSFIGAMIGAAIWAGIAYATNFEIAYIAWAIGGLAGGGMYLGFRNQSTIAGLIASFMAVLGIVVGKIGYVVLVLLPVMGAVASAMNSANSRDSETEAVSQGNDTMEVYALADHHAELKANRQGLSYEDDRRDTMLEQEEKRFKAMTPEQLKKAGEDMEKWNEGGKWKDPAYVRDFLIYTYIDEAMEAEAEKQEVDTYELETTPAQWQLYYRAAAKRADGIPADQRVAEAKKIEAEHEKAMAEVDEEAEDGAAEIATGFLALFFASMFGIFDILFIILAVATAYHLASGLSFGG